MQDFERANPRQLKVQDKQLRERILQAIVELSFPHQVGDRILGGGNNMKRVGQPGFFQSPANQQNFFLVVFSNQDQLLVEHVFIKGKDQLDLAAVIYPKRLFSARSREGERHLGGRS